MNSKSIFRSIENRIRLQKGETIVETLVSVLISSLALLLLATAIGTTVNIVRSSNAKMEELYNDEGSLVDGARPGNPGGQHVTFSVPLDSSNVSVDIEWYQSENGEFAFYEKKVIP